MVREYAPQEPAREPEAPQTTGLFPELGKKETVIPEWAQKVTANQLKSVRQTQNPRSFVGVTGQRKAKAAPPPKKPLPDRLKVGLEPLAGYSIEQVRELHGRSNIAPSVSRSTNVSTNVSPGNEIKMMSRREALSGEIVAVTNLTNSDKSYTFSSKQSSVIQLTSKYVTIGKNFKRAIKKESGTLRLTPEPLNDADLKQVGKDDSLIIDGAHGNEQEYGNYTAAQLAKVLYERGLRAVHSIELRGCNTGGEYNRNLKEELAKRNVKVSNVWAPKTAGMNRSSDNAATALSLEADRKSNEIEDKIGKLKSQLKEIRRQIKNQRHESNILNLPDVDLKINTQKVALNEEVRRIKKEIRKSKKEQEKVEKDRNQVISPETEMAELKQKGASNEEIQQARETQGLRRFLLKEDDPWHRA